MTLLFYGDAVCLGRLPAKNHNGGPKLDRIQLEEPALANFRLKLAPLTVAVGTVELRYISRDNSRLPMPVNRLMALPGSHLVAALRMSLVGAHPRVSILRACRLRHSDWSHCTLHKTHRDSEGYATR